MLKTRRSHDRIIFTMGIPYPGKTALILRRGLRTVPVNIRHSFNHHKCLNEHLNISTYINDTSLYVNTLFLIAPFPCPKYILIFLENTREMLSVKLLKGIQQCTTVFSNNVSYHHHFIPITPLSRRGFTLEAIDVWCRQRTNCLLSATNCLPN